MVGGSTAKIVTADTSSQAKQSPSRLAEGSPRAAKDPRSTTRGAVYSFKGMKVAELSRNYYGGASPGEKFRFKDMEVGAGSSNHYGRPSPSRCESPADEAAESSQKKDT